MLAELRIGQLGLVDEIDLPCGPGLTMLTGETGAGKSMIAGALALLCGGRADRERVRDGADVGWVEAVFDLAEAPEKRRLCAEAGIVLAEDHILVLRREIRREGRGRISVNGRLSSLAVLERIGPRLLSVQSQHQHLEVARPGFARDILDRGLELEVLRDEVARLWRAWRDREDVLARRRQEAEAAREQADLWRFQRDELAAAHLDPDEESRLGESLRLQQNAAGVRDAAAAALSLLEGGEEATRERLARALGALDPVADVSHRLEEAVASLRDAEASLAEASLGLDRFLDGLELDPRGLDDLQERKALYEELRRKYRLDVPEMIRRLALLDSRLADHDAADRELEEMVVARDAARTQLADASAGLRRARQDGAEGLARRAERILRPLALPALTLEFGVEPRRDAEDGVDVGGVRCRTDADGSDEIVLRVVTNVGERARPVEQVASGGERSRIHLGLTVLVRSREEPPLLLLDEIDSGLGLDAALPVARLLRDLSRDSQLLCITHLPSMAAYGLRHWSVGKRERAGRTVLEVRQLTGEDRVQEIERLLGAVPRGDAAGGRGDYARTLLKSAE